jgi:hypothetical protein
MIFKSILFRLNAFHSLQIEFATVLGGSGFCPSIGLDVPKERSQLYMVLWTSELKRQSIVHDDLIPTKLPYRPGDKRDTGREKRQTLNLPYLAGLHRQGIATSNLKSLISCLILHNPLN